MRWLRTRSLRSRLSLYISAPILVICIFQYVFFPARHWLDAQAALAERTRSVAVMTAFTAGPALSFGDRISAGEALAAVAQVPDLAYVVVYTESGEVFAVHDPLQLWRSRVGPLEPSDGLVGDVFEVVVPVVHDQVRVGWLQVGLTLTALRAEAERSRRSIAVITLLLLLAGFVASLIVSRHVVQPVSQMVSTFGHISEGDLTRRSPVVSADELGQLAGAFNTMVAGLESTQKELRQAHDGLELRVEERTHELLLANEALQREIGERQTAQAAHSAAQAQLERQRALGVQADRLRSLGEMAAGIAHELNQPLMVVRGLAEHTLISRERGRVESDEKLHDRLERTIEQVDRMVHIVEHVRLFAREAGRPETKRVEVTAVVESACGMLDNQYRSHGINLRLDLRQPLPDVLANPYSLEEVLINLLNNARDAVAKKLEDNLEAVILVRTGIRPGADVEMVTIEVVDNGTGIDADILPRILEPFYTTKDPTSGTGLGLSVSHSIIEQFDGFLEIESTLGVGTTARVILPAAAPDS